MNNRDLQNEYFDWLYELVCKNRYSKNVSLRKLLMHLHSKEFTYIIDMDENRAIDGIALRWQFVYTRSYPTEFLDYLIGPCSILEMMIALSFKCEDVMDDPAFGNRFEQWFWHMIVSLGLGGMTDDLYNKRRTTMAINKFLNRNYDPNGKGGLFTIRNCRQDLRDVEIWYQMCWYLNEYY